MRLEEESMYCLGRVEDCVLAAEGEEGGAMGGRDEGLNAREQQPSDEAGTAGRMGGSRKEGLERAGSQGNGCVSGTNDGRDGASGVSHELLARATAGHAHLALLGGLYSEAAGYLVTCRQALVEGQVAAEKGAGLREAKVADASVRKEEAKGSTAVSSKGHEEGIAVAMPHVPALWSTGDVSCAEL